MSTINIVATDHWAEEGVSTALVTFLRDTIEGSETCYFSLSGSAEAGLDYDAIKDSITFADGQDRISVIINPTKDSLTDDGETITCTIVENSAYTIGERASATVTLRDEGFVGEGFVAPLDETFLLNSKPDAEHIIYLNFLGGNYYNLNTILTYDTDGNSTTFSNTEKLEIQHIWAGIAEDFAPFDLNVTTEQPTEEALVNSGDGDENWGVSLLIGEETSGYGFAWSGSDFHSSENSPGYVSIGSASDSFWPLDLIAAGGSHELAHTMGLSHDGPGPGGYYPGHETEVALWTPIMGQSNSGLTQFSRGEYSGATEQQDDLSIITSHTTGIDYIVDDHADTMPFATALVHLDDNYGTLYAQGIVHKTEDVDWFMFEHSGGGLVLNIDVAEFSPNLHVGAWLYDEFGNEIISSASDDSLSASLISDNLNAGRYYMKVDGIGNQTGEGYTDYGSLGRYVVSTGAAVLADFDPDGENAKSNIDGGSQLTGVTLSSLSSNGLGSAAADDAWALWWSGGDTIDLDQYIAFSVAPTAANKAVITETLEVSFYSFVDGSTEFLLRSSQDNFQTTIDSLSINGSLNAELLSFDLSVLPQLEGTTEFRIYTESDIGGYRYLTGGGWTYDERGQGLQLTGRLVDVNAPPVNLGSDIGIFATMAETWAIEYGSQAILVGSSLSDQIFVLDELTNQQTHASVFVGDGDDTVTDSSGDDFVMFGGGVDTLNVSSGADLIYKAGSGSLTINASPDGVWGHGYYAQNVGLANSIGTENLISLAGFNRFHDTLALGDGQIDVTVNASLPNNATTGCAVFTDDVFSPRHADVNPIAQFFTDSDIEISAGLRSFSSVTPQSGASFTINGSEFGDLFDFTTELLTAGSPIEGYQINYFGHGGDDVIWGSAHANIDGGAGDDIINGGYGDNMLTGGFGSDTFEFTATSGNDTITDFDKDEDELHFYFREGEAEESAVASINNGIVTWDAVTVDLGDSSLVMDDLNITYEMV
jgi:hypothetical protein